MWLAAFSFSLFPFLFLLLASMLSAYYAYLMWRYRKHWRALPPFTPSPQFTPTVFLSILIPARNEAENIEACLHSILQQNYPAALFEIIVIDDHSTDQTAAIVRQIQAENSQVHLIRLANIPAAQNQNAFKKFAIEQGIQQARGTLIIGTDADCLVPPEWLRLMAAFYESSQAVFIAAPVNFFREKSNLEYFQSLDFVGMMGITGAGIQGHFQHMCNGANLAYEKAAFEAVGGFSGIDGKASGDDMLLLQKMIRRFPGRIGFLKNPGATVRTRAMPDWASFVSQRIRWASKSYDYPEWRVTLRLVLVFLYCWAIILTFLLLPIMGWTAVIALLLMLGTKTLVDYFFLREMSQYFGREDLMEKYPVSIPLHLIYIAWVGLMANFTQTYKWKGRKIR